MIWHKILVLFSRIIEVNIFEKLTVEEELRLASIDNSKGMQRKMTFQVKVQTMLSID